MKKFALSLALLSLFSCRTQSSKQSSAELTSPYPEMDLWNQYVQNEIGNDKIQRDCVPRIYRADPSVERKGMLMFFHGFTACPQQYFAISERLSKLGYDVYLPLMPGQGREIKGGKAEEEDNYQTLPSRQYYGGGVNGRREDLNNDGINDRYVNFVSVMNQIAAKTPAGNRVIGGLSGGAALATGAAIAGQGIWDRILVYAPYYQNHGLNEALSSFLGSVMPGFVNNWGDECRANRRRVNGRAGLCALTVGAIRSMTEYGSAQADQIEKIQIPMQFVGVDFDQTADVGRIVRTFVKAKNARICLYPNGVPHSIINPASDDPALDPYWVPGMQDDSINFITQGTWFPTGKPSEEKYKEATLLSCYHPS